ncbi:aldehyde dehydrogenase family protein [Gottfriedia sp. NPDC056225]|uniref:aldehyde dehydrogenase family protein n=1 Tax=Gottfriedia sp. NPDC056225 TaxID=3345751 RepID=UPI0035D6C0FD
MIEMEEMKILEKYSHFIDGTWKTPKQNKYFTNMNPVTGEKLTFVARGSSEDIDLAIKNAEKGFETWCALKPSARGQIIMKIAERIRENQHRLAFLETLDTGRPLFLSMQMVESSARFFEYLGGAADKIFGDVIPAHNDYLTYTLREPYGVVGIIIPWNAPLQTASRDVSAALAAGNAVVLKPAEQAGLSVLELAAICIEAGLPPGVFNVVNGLGNEAGNALIHHPSIQKITFTGSVQTGKHIMKAAAEQIVPVTVELGGKSPNIVFEDANLTEAIKGSLKAFLANSGQVCAAGTRLFVQRSIQESFVTELIEQVKGVKIGNGLTNPMMGPLISDKQLERVLQYIDIGKKEGATLEYGGKRLSQDGYFIEPTIFTNVDNSMKIAREEIFGPVVSIIPFDTEEEVIALANESEFGLSASVWTENIHRGHRVAKKVLAGQVYINDFMPIDVEAPFGGYKKSGIGREKGLESLLTYTQVKTITTKM